MHGHTHTQFKDKSFKKRERKKNKVVPVFKNNKDKASMGPWCSVVSKFPLRDVLGPESHKPRVTAFFLSHQKQVKNPHLGSILLLPKQREASYVTQ